ncbi:hypothetical protein TcWFU_004237 [Taenia crassiceps]|uniref:Uncharacterized protein n=1 Tax=Taenia crassiceps TaxID=6207 RepID=A0ABR4Q695_9CEST
MSTNSALVLTLVVLLCHQTTASPAEALSKNKSNEVEHGNNHINSGGLSAPQQLLLHLSVRCCFCIIFVILLLHSV